MAPISSLSCLRVRFESPSTRPPCPSARPPTYDLDGTTITPDGIWIGSLASGESNLDVDFGYTGTGSLGDLVWFDTDGDGDPTAGRSVFLM